MGEKGKGKERGMYGKEEIIFKIHLTYLTYQITAAQYTIKCWYLFTMVILWQTDYRCGLLPLSSITRESSHVASAGKD